MNHSDQDKQTDWNHLKSLKDEEIDTSDIPELDMRFWEIAEIVTPQSKKPISIRLDEDVLEWFKKQGRGYQSRINAVLRAYMESTTKPD